MRRPSKKAIALCFLVGGLGALGAAVLPRADDLKLLGDDLAILLQRPLYDDQRRQLALHLPGFFGTRHSCLFRYAKGEWRTILPGDLVQSYREGGDLTCTNGDKFHLHANTSVRFWLRRGGQTFLELERGWLSGTAGKQPVRLGLNAAEVDIRPRAETRFLASANSGETFLKCLDGFTLLSLSRRLDEPLLLESGACRMEVQRPDETPRFTLAAGERAYASDLALSFSARPEIAPVKRAARVEAEIAGLEDQGLNLSAAGEGKLNLTALRPQDDCELYSYRPGEEPVELHDYPRLENTMTANLPAGARAPLFFQCKTAGVVRTSKFLASLKVTAPPPAAPAPAPAVLNAPAPASTKPAPKLVRAKPKK